MDLLAISYPKLKPQDYQWIQAIRSRHDPYYELVEPHFSLIFEISDIGQDEFIAQVRPICEATPKIEFSLRYAKVIPGMANDNWYLFLVPEEGYGDIIRLHDRLYTGILSRHLRLDIPYIPHITTGIFNDSVSCKRAADETNLEKFNISGVIENIDIISAQLAPQGRERLETVERIDLRRG